MLLSRAMVVTVAVTCTAVGLASPAWADERLDGDYTFVDGATTTNLGVELPKVLIPLNPGKNITVVAEVVAMNHLLRYSGVNTAEAFNQRLMKRMQATEPAAIRQYLQEDDE